MASEANLVGLRLMEGPGAGKRKPCHTTVLSLLLKWRLTCTFSPGWFSLVELFSIEEIFSWQGQRKQGRAGCARLVGSRQRAQTWASGTLTQIPAQYLHISYVTWGNFARFPFSHI